MPRSFALILAGIGGAAIVMPACAIDDDGDIGQSETTGAGTWSGGDTETSTGDAEGGAACDPFDVEAICADACAVWSQCSGLDENACTTMCIDSAASGALAGAACAEAFGELQCCVTALECAEVEALQSMEPGAPCLAESEAALSECS